MSWRGTVSKGASRWAEGSGLCAIGTPGEGLCSEWPRSAVAMVSAWEGFSKHLLKQDPTTAVLLG